MPVGTRRPQDSIDLPIQQVRMRRYPDGCRQPVHAHDSASVTLVLQGRIREAAAGQEVTAGPLALVIKPAGTRHANCFGPTSVLTCQVILDPAAHDLPRWRSALARWQWIPGGPPLAAAVELARDVVSGEEPATVAAGAAALLECLGTAPSPRGAPAWMPRARECIEAMLRDPAGRVSVTAVAAAVGVHPVHLCRVFQNAHGCSVMGWVRRRRVQLAADRLRPAGGPLSAVAAAAGFADQSHMNRAFSRETGVLPSAWQTLVAAASRPGLDSF